MDKNMSVSPLNSSLKCNDDSKNIRSKIRRLRIQEALLLQSLQKEDKNYNEDRESLDTELQTFQYKVKLTKVKKSYINLKNLFDEVKTNTQSQELLADLDIDEVKKQILELESNIKLFKAEISSELAALRESHEEINQIPTKMEYVKRRPKTHLVKYNAIVQSPVRVLMTSPLKCLEVQQFQKFMQNSPNRYGGWNEYNHNIFVKYWQKHFGKNNFEFQDNTLQQSMTKDAFIEDVAPKLHGITLNDVASHVKWYTIYVCLKEKQQNAIDKWKSNKMTLKNTQKKVKYANECESLPLTTMDEQDFKSCNLASSKHVRPVSKNKIQNTKPSTAKRKISNQDRSNSIMKPTKQWISRNHDDSDEAVVFQCIDNMDKLRTPHWRQGL